jgi:asparagine synthetase B (glutamine-hydrolysing)
MYYAFFLAGLGSEEIFAGYDRHEKALEQGGNDALHNECLAGLKKMYQRDLRRDTLIPQALGVTAATPFLDTALVRFALSIPPELKINSEKTFTGKLQGDVDGEKRYKKLILRQTAEKMGLPRDIAFRPKRAAQYGSRTNNALTALRKRAGCRDKEEYLKILQKSN